MRAVDKMGGSDAEIEIVTWSVEAVGLWVASGGSGDGILKTRGQHGSASPRYPVAMGFDAWMVMERWRRRVTRPIVEVRDVGGACKIRAKSYGGQVPKVSAI